MASAMMKKVAKTALTAKFAGFKATEPPPTTATGKTGRVKTKLETTAAQVNNKPKSSFENFVLSSITLP